MKLILLFKYELIKIIVFLFLFFFSLIFVLSAQDSYYEQNNSSGKTPNNIRLIETIKEQEQTKD